MAKQAAEHSRRRTATKGDGFASTRALENTPRKNKYQKYIALSATCNAQKRVALTSAFVNVSGTALVLSVCESRTIH
jgi:hypothetical protein